MSRHRLPLFVAMVCSATLFAGPALADRIPSSVKTSSTPSHNAVMDYFKTQFNNLASADPQVQKAARESMISECGGHAGLSASPEYGTEYATDLGNVLAWYSHAPELRVRLNVAVVVANVAAQVYRDGGSSAGLAPLVETLLKDKQAAVVLWAARAARYVLASKLTDNVNASGLAKAVVAAVKNHPESGPIVEEAYSSLTLEGLDKLKGSPPFQQNAPNLIPAILDLVAWRGDQYKNGGSVPSPLADRPVAVFLSVTAFGAVNSNPALLKRTLKVMGETTCSTIHSVANGNSSPELLDMVHGYGDAMFVFGQQMPNLDVQNAGKAIQGITQTTDPTKVNTTCDTLVAALKSAGVDIVVSNGPGAGEQAPAPAIAGSAK